MNATWAIARKEWRAAFLSPVALIFLGVFLWAALFVFFFLEGFFARNIADAKPFFEHMPLLLVLLCSAFTMRLWSDEAKSGTLEVLLTLPVRIRDVVLGKFAAGLGLVAVALLLTLPVPIFIEILGDLDWGPVIGGYLGLLLLASAYLAIGMLISSLTSNQLVALMLSMVTCGGLVGLGYLPELTTLGMATDEILRALGTGSRFASMLRGVLDLGDLVYYLSLAGLGLAGNALVLEARRWGRTRSGQRRRGSISVAMMLLAANLLVLNVGLYLVRGARLDLTEWDEYSISPTTRSLIEGASEPLLVRGYFSDQTHPLLDPLVPTIRDFLRELEAVGGGNLTVEFVDPTQDDALAAEAKRDYGIDPVPFHFSDRHADSVVNAYFHILVRYGDRHEVLDYQDLIEVDFAGEQIKVRLRNLEYDVARAIRKTVYGFVSLETICQQLPAPAELKLIASSSGLPAQLSEVPARIEAVAEEFSKRCGKRFSWKRIDPDSGEEGTSPQALYDAYGIKPLALNLLDQHGFYLDLVLQVGKRREVLSAASSPTEAALRTGLQAALQRQVPGHLKTVGLVTPKPQRPMMPGMPPGGATFRMLRKALEENHEVRTVDLADGRVPAEVDALLVLAPEGLQERERFALDQFLMRGGSLILADGAQAFDPGPGGGLSTKPVHSGLSDLLAGWGVEVGDAVVLDEENATFPVPVERKVGPGLVMREVRMVDYPPFVLVHGEGLGHDNPVTRALNELVVHYGSPVSCAAPADPAPPGEGAAGPARGCRPLLTSSDKAWTQAAFNAQPDYDKYGSLGFAQPDKRQKVNLAVAVRGQFDSHFKGKQAPLLDKQEPPARPGQAIPDPSEIRSEIIEQSPPDTRLVVIGSSSFVSDMMLALTQQVSDMDRANLQFVTNLVDWAIEDPGLLAIRSKERFARSLPKLETAEMAGWEIGQFALAGLAVLAIGLFTLGSRGRARPIPLVDGDQDGKE